MPPPGFEPRTKAELGTGHACDRLLSSEPVCLRQRRIRLRRKKEIDFFVPPPGFEPGTVSLKGSCSTN